jgi:hypothetical protein
MSRTRNAFTACVVASAAALAAASALGRAWALIPLPAAIGALWLLSRARGKSMAASVLLSILVCSSGACVLAGFSPALGLAASLSALAAWDLDRFSRTVEGATAGEAVRRVERLHLLRLLAVCGTGGLAGLLSLLVRLRVGFAALLATGVLLAAGLTALVRLMRSS